MAEVLNELFKRLERSHFYISRFGEDLEADGTPAKAAQQQGCRDRINELAEYQRQNSLFIPFAITETFREYLSRAKRIYRNVSDYYTNQIADHEARIKLYEDNRDEIVKLGQSYNVIHAQLQRLLGLDAGIGKAV